MVRTWALEGLDLVAGRRGWAACELCNLGEGSVPESVPTPVKFEGQ